MQRISGLKHQKLRDCRYLRIIKRLVKNRIGVGQPTGASQPHPGAQDCKATDPTALLLWAAAIAHESHTERQRTRKSRRLQVWGPKLTGPHCSRGAGIRITGEGVPPSGGSPQSPGDM